MSKAGFVLAASILFLALVSPAAAARPVSVTMSIKAGETLSGQVAWEAKVTRSAKTILSSISFSIDGALRYTGTTSPSVYNLDTRTLAAGSHTFSVVATTSSGTATSTATATVQNEVPTNTSLPTISGTAEVGKTLTGSAGSWTGSPTSFAYQWLSCDSAGTGCAAIAGATGSGYVLVSEEAGRTVRVQVTASNVAGQGTATSAATGFVVQSSFGISQSIAPGQTLSSIVSWTATPSGIATADVAKVEFLVDSNLVLTESSAPYGDTAGHFDSRSITNGSHVFTVRATARDGRVASGVATATVANGSVTVPGQPSFPIYATFYYPWFPETWTVSGQHVFFRPTLGYYSTTDVAIQQAHVRAMEYAGMEASISSWWGAGHYSTTRLKQLLQTTASMGSALKWSIYHEMEGYQNPSVDTLAAELAFIRDNLATSPAFLKVNGRFVVFVYNADDFTCNVADRWEQANSRIGNAAYVVLKVFSGYRNCASQPDSWHQYGPSTAIDEQPGYSITISPGFWRADEPSPRLARDLTRWRSNVSSLVSSTAPWKLVATFNEWTEGTAVESALDWGSASGEGTYMDALHSAIVGS